MPTIIERIAAAEADADAIRRNAAEAARNVKAQAEEDAAISLRVAREEAKTELALCDRMAENEGRRTAEALIATRTEEADAVVSAAAKKLDSAVEIIIKRITE